MLIMPFNLYPFLIKKFAHLIINVLFEVRHYMTEVQSFRIHFNKVHTHITEIEAKIVEPTQ